MSLFADHNLPFAVALLFMVLLAAVQAIGLDFTGDADLDIGTDIDAGLDADFDADGLPGGGIGAFIAGVLGFGRVPLTIWLATFLFAFAAIGVSGQALSENLLGAPMDALVAAVLAAVAAAPVTSVLVRPLGRILPRDETTAVTLDSLVGRRAEVTTGTSRAGSPARSRVNDMHGHPHYVMVEPHDDSADIVEGEQVLLVRREGEVFFGAKLEERRLSPTL